MVIARDERGQVLLEPGGVATSKPIPPNPPCESKAILENGRTVQGKTSLEAGSATKAAADTGELCEFPP
jgi:hypothetical protein